MLEEPDALFDDIWGKMKEEEMVDVPKDWVPKNDKLKIEGEQWQILQNINLYQLTKLTGNN